MMGFNRVRAGVRAGTRVRVALAAAICLGAALIQTPLTAAASGPTIVAGPSTQSQLGVTVTWVGVATSVTIGGSNEASLACDAVQTTGISLGVGVDCWLTDDGGVTVPISAKNGIQLPSIAGLLVSPPALAGPALIKASANYQLCGFAFFWDAVNTFHEMPGTCSSALL